MVMANLFLRQKIIFKTCLSTLKSCLNFDFFSNGGPCGAGATADRRGHGKKSAGTWRRAGSHVRKEETRSENCGRVHDRRPPVTADHQAGAGRSCHVELGEAAAGAGTRAGGCRDARRTA